MPLGLRFQLSFMMFLNYVVWGAWYSTITTYLTTTLGFTGTQAGAVFGTAALSCMISPFFVGLVADRYFPAQRVMAVLHLVGAGLLYAVAQAKSFGAIYALMLTYNLCYFPTVSLCNSLAMRNMTDAGSQFPLVRVFATIGWIVISLVIGKLAVEQSATQFLIAAGCSVAMGLYSFTLPHTPPAASTGKVTVRGILGLDALVMLKDRSYAVFVIASVLACIPLTFYFSFVNPYLNAAGVAEPASKMALGQASEIGMMIAMPFIFRKLGVKMILVLGLLAWTTRYVLLALGNADSGMWMFYAAILLHGICYDFFFMTGQIYTDQQAPARLRNTAQGFIIFLTYGVGMTTGSLLSGVTADAFKTPAGQNWSGFWMASAAGAGAILLLVMLLFRDSGRISAEEKREEQVAAA